MKPGCKPIFIKTTAYTKVHSNEVSANPYTGVELPTTIGVHNGDTVSVQFSDGTIVDYTFNGTIWEVNFANNWAEERICLNNVDPLIVVADINNPTTAEIQAWATSNLTYEQRVNGTILTYYIDGDCDNPDFTWVLNKGSELITLTDKRVFNTKTVYVDAGSGSDVTGMRGYRNYPFKTLDAAINILQEGDLLYVFPGDYTTNITYSKLFNIYCESGVNWKLNTNLFSTTISNPNNLRLKWRFDKLYSDVGNLYALWFITLINDLSIYADEFQRIRVGGLTKTSNIEINKCIDCYTVISSTGTTDAQNTTLVHNATLTQTPNYLITFQNADNSQSTFKTDNLNAVIGNGAAAPFSMFFTSDSGINKEVDINFKNIIANSINPPIAPVNPMSIWPNGPSMLGATNKVGILRGGVRNGTNVSITIDNIISNADGIGIGSQFSPIGAHININMRGLYTKGVPIWTGELEGYQNSTIILNLDVICNDAYGILFGCTDGSYSNIHPSNTIIVTGRIKTTLAGYPCIKISTGTAGSNNTNGTILLKDLTLINDGTVSPIMCAVSENVMIQNVKSNSLITDPNIVEVGESIIRNSNYK